MGADEGAAKARMDKILLNKDSPAGSAVGEAYRAAVAEAQKMADLAKEALTKLNAQQQIAASEVAGIMKGLISLSELSRLSADLTGARDVRLLRYLEDMRSRAKELMQQSLYNIAMAFRYQYLADVPDGFFDIQKRIDGLAQVALYEKNNQGGLQRRQVDGRDMTIATLPDADYAKFDGQVLSDLFLQMAQIPLADLYGGRNTTSHDLPIVIEAPPLPAPVKAEVKAPDGIGKGPVLVSELLVKKGDAVAAGACLAKLEIFGKHLVEVPAPIEGVVEEVAVQKGAEVQKGDLIARIEPLQAHDPKATERRWLEALSLTGDGLKRQLALDPIGDLGLGNYSVPLLRLGAITMDNKGVAFADAPDEDVSFRITFTAPKQTVIMDARTGGDAYYFFQKGEDEWPRVWGFTVTRRKDKTIAVEEDKQEKDVVIGKAVNEDVTVGYYHPGLYGPPFVIRTEILGKNRSSKLRLSRLEFKATLFERPRPPSTGQPTISAEP